VRSRPGAQVSDVLGDKKQSDKKDENLHVVVVQVLIINGIFSNNLSLLGRTASSMRMPPGATDMGVREDYELRDGASPSALERCAISALLRVCRFDVGQDLTRAYLDVRRYDCVHGSGGRRCGCSEFSDLPVGIQSLPLDQFAALLAAAT
jgi:hypothetical protein